MAKKVVGVVILIRIKYDKCYRQNLMNYKVCDRLTRRRLTSDITQIAF